MEVTIYQRIMSILEDKQLSVNAFSKIKSEKVVLKKIRNKFEKDKKLEKDF